MFSVQWYSHASPLGTVGFRVGLQGPVPPPPPPTELVKDSARDLECRWKGQCDRDPGKVRPVNTRSGIRFLCLVLHKGRKTFRVSDLLLLLERVYRLSPDWFLFGVPDLPPPVSPPRLNRQLLPTPTDSCPDRPTRHISAELTV